MTTYTNLMIKENFQFPTPSTEDATNAAEEWLMCNEENVLVSHEPEIAEDDGEAEWLIQNPNINSRTKEEIENQAIDKAMSELFGHLYNY